MTTANLNLQAIFGKLTDDELQELSKFLGDESKGAAAKTCVLLGSCQNETKRRNPQPPPAKLAQDEQLAAVIKGWRHNSLVVLGAVDGTTFPIQKLDNPAFYSALSAIKGVNGFFGDEAAAAIKARDVGFFKACVEALKPTKSKPTKSKGKPTKGKATKDPKARMAQHLTAAILILKREAGRGNRTVKKMELQKAVSTTLTKYKLVSFSDEDSWAELWKRPELEPFVEQARNGRIRFTTGRGRGVESFDVMPQWLDSLLP
jgi:hypothetical protein